MKNENSISSSTTHISMDTRLEAKLKVDQKNLGKALRALEKAGVEFELVSVEKPDSPSYTYTYPVIPSYPTYPPTYPWYVWGDPDSTAGDIHVYQPYTTCGETDVETY